MAKIYLPEKMDTFNQPTVRSHAGAEGWNACIAKVVELNTNSHQTQANAVEVHTVAAKLLDASRTDMAEGFDRISISCSELELVCKHVVDGERA